MDTLGQILWHAIPFTPLFTIPIIWKFSKQHKIIRVLIGLGLACIISFLCFHISLAICFRDGMGPG